MNIERESWKIIELIIRRYPDKKKEYTDFRKGILESKDTQARNAGTGRRSLVESPTEYKTIQLSCRFENRIGRELEAIERVYYGLLPEEQKIMEERFWSDRKRNKQYSMINVGYSERQMKRIVYKIIYQVGKQLGEIK